MLTHDRALQTKRTVSKDKPILAFKQFHVKVVEGKVRYTPISSNNYPEGGWVRNIPYTAHSVPTTRNTYVGFHAIKRPTLRMFRTELCVCLPVKLWGRIVEHRGTTHRSYPYRPFCPAGYRAQFMEIL
jgi:hypothetical protein